MLFGNSSYSKEEIQELLKIKRELIKNNPEYYGNGNPSKSPDYIWYKKFISTHNDDGNS